MPDLLAFEKECRTAGLDYIAGVDEAGRGPLAGPVVAAAVVLPPKPELGGVIDSKQLTPSKRENLLPIIAREALAVGIGIVDVAVIDRENIYQATRLAMGQAVSQLNPFPDHLLLDGPLTLDLPVPQTPIIKGDGRSLSIAAASIVAKVIRDRLMQDLHQIFPEYGFARHKGYPTVEHLANIKEYGPSLVHRYSFQPVRQAAHWSEHLLLFRTRVLASKTLASLVAIRRTIGSNRGLLGSPEQRALQRLLQWQEKRLAWQPEPRS